MASLAYIIYTENMVGASHPTASDTLNRTLRDLLTRSGYNPDADPISLTVLPGNLTWLADNTNDLGAVGANRPRDLFLARDLTVGRHAALAGNVSLTQFNAGNSGATFTVDWNSGNNQRLTLSANCTVTLSNGKAGGVYTLELVQDGTGSRLVTWAASGAAVIWPNAAAPTLTTTLNKADIFTFYYDGVPGTPKYCGSTYGLAYAV